MNRSVLVLLATYMLIPLSSRAEYCHVEYKIKLECERQGGGSKEFLRYSTFHWMKKGQICRSIISHPIGSIEQQTYASFLDKSGVRRGIVSNFDIFPETDRIVPLIKETYIDGNSDPRANDIKLFNNPNEDYLVFVAKDSNQDRMTIQFRDENIIFNCHQSEQ